MLGGWARGGMAQATADGSQPQYRAVNIVRFAREQLSVNARLAIGQKHRLDFIQREPGGLSQRDERELIRDFRCVASARPLLAHRSYESFLPVVAQCGRRDSRAPDNFRNIHG